MNVGPAWQKGYTGKGVVVSILDDGIQRNHPDLDKNYVSKILNFNIFNFIDICVTKTFKVFYKFFIFKLIFTNYKEIYDTK